MKNGTDMQLPKGWKILPISQVTSLFDDGDWIESKDQSPDGIRLIQTGNVGIGRFKDRGEKARYISENTFNRLKCTEIFPNDVIVSRLPDPVGRACILPDTGDKMITAVDCTIIRFKQEQVISKWFVYYSMSQLYLDEISKQITGATRQRISRKNLGVVKLPLPPLPEQHRIVAILDRCFTAIDRAKTIASTNLQNARELFESYLNGVFEKGGKDWEVKDLDSICNLITCGVAARPNYVTSGVAFLSAKNIKDGNVIWDDFKFISDETHAQLTKNNKPIKGDILYTRVGSYGEAAVIETEREFSLFVSLTLIKVKSEHILNYYLKYYLNSSGVKKMAKKSISGSGVGNLNVGTVRKFPVPLPSVQIQQQIVSQLDALQKETKRLEEHYTQKLHDLEELKKAVLQKAFSGELVTDTIALPS